MVTTKTWHSDPNMVPSGRAYLDGWRLVYNVRSVRSDCKKGKYLGFIFTATGYKKVYLKSFTPL